MNGLSKTVLVMLAVTVIAGVGGGWLGVRYGVEHARPSAGLDQLLHHELTLTADQQRQIEQIEADFKTRRKVLEDQMRAANRELAAAVLNQHQYGPDAEKAIEHFHEAMKTLQEETIRHVYAMRAVLTPGQVQKFDQTVAWSLESDQS